VLFVFVGVILVFIQGKYIGPLSRRFGEHRLIHAGLALVGIGLILTAITPQQPVTWYSREAIVQSLTEAGSAQEQDIALDLPADDQNGWLGLIWIMVALVPASIGGGMLSPSINSLITKRAAAGDVGGTLGVSSALVSLANAVTPLIGGSLFQFLGSTAPFLIGGLLLLVLMAFALRGVTSSNQRGAEQLA
jgi:MFS transporter, DHA1 family, tetracycline resistance protein